MGKEGYNLSRRVKDLRFLNCGGTCRNGCSAERFGDKIGLSLIYLGVESGSTDALRLATKGYTQRDLFRAAEIVLNSDVGVSAIVINGLGGIRHSASHIKDTVKFLNYLKPRFVTFMGINAGPNTRYTMKMQREMAAGKNIPLSDMHLTEQMACIVEELNFSTTLGCHGEDIHGIRYNPVTFGSVETRSQWENLGLADRIRQMNH